MFYSVLHCFPVKRDLKRFASVDLTIYKRCRRNSSKRIGLNQTTIKYFDLILYVPVNNLSVTSGRVFLGWTSTKLGRMFLTQGHNAVTPVRLEPVALRSRVKHSTTKPLRSLYILMHRSRPQSENRNSYCFMYRCLYHQVCDFQ